jgi:hypothetical protein
MTSLPVGVEKPAYRETRENGTTRTKRPGNGPYFEKKEAAT